MNNAALAPMIASLAMKMLAARQNPMVGPMPEPPGRGMEVRTIYPETFPDEVGRVYGDWQGDPREKMTFLTDDDRMAVLQGKNERMDTSLSKFIGILARNRMSVGRLKEIVHNHNAGEKISPADLEFLSAIKKLGFKGSYKVYYPKGRRLREEK